MSKDVYLAAAGSLYRTYANADGLNLSRFATSVSEEADFSAKSLDMDASKGRDLPALFSKRGGQPGYEGDVEAYPQTVVSQAMKHGKRSAGRPFKTERTKAISAAACWLSHSGEVRSSRDTGYGLDADWYPRVADWQCSHFQATSLNSRSPCVAKPSDVRQNAWRASNVAAVLNYSGGRQSLGGHHNFGGVTTRSNLNRRTSR